MMFLLVIIALSIILGALLCLVVQYIVITKWYSTLPVLSPPRKPQYDAFQLPKEIVDLLKNPDQKNQTCVCLNLLLQFLFTELRDTNRLRKWVMKRMDIEFEELLQTTTTGKLLDSITVRDFNLGGVFPVIKDVSVNDVKLHDADSIEEVCVLVDLDYGGGFRLAVDVDMVFGKSAYLSVKITKLVGRARLQMTRIPYTHWTFAFIEEPVIEFDVESQFEGRQIIQLTSVIINQIRKSIRKKHTLPNYKIRYKPFFVKPEIPKVPKPIHCQGSKLSVGEITVTVIQCTRLAMLQGETDLPVYCSLALNKMTWAELMNTRRKQWTPYDVQIDKSQALNVGLTFKEELIIDRAETMVVVELVTQNSPAGLANIKKGDVVISVNGNKVLSIKQAARLIKAAPESFHMVLERSSVFKGVSPLIHSDFKYNEDNVSLADETECQQMTEEYINISINKLSDPDKVNKSPEGQTTISLEKEQAFISSLPVKSDLIDLRQRRKGSLDSKSLNNNVSFGSPEAKPKQSSPKSGLRPNKSDPQVLKRTGSQKENKESEVDLRKTKCVKSGQDPVFQQEFTFQVQDKDDFLNVCVWCRIPEKLDRQNRVLKPEKDILLGHVSIPLMDIALECMSTIQGDYQQTFQITPTEARAGASRSKFTNLAAHRGFDESLCHGDVTLAFIHSTQPMSKAERQKILKLRRDSQEASQQKQAMLRRETKKVLIEGEHDFSNVKFTTTTCCDFCHKKIWFKNGFQCELCDLICHKKCMDRCQSYTKCSKDGWSFRDPKFAAEYAKKAVKQVKVPEKQPIPEPSQQNQPPSSSQTAATTPTKVPFLARFRRDKGLGQTPPSSSANPPRRRVLPTALLQRNLNILKILERQRSNSLSNVGHSGSDSDQRSSKEETVLAAGSSIQKARSSSSIHEITNTPHGESESDSEGEINLMRYYEQQKHTARSDEMVVTAAKQMGRELYNYLPPDQRKTKLDASINKLQLDIDQASEYRADLSKQFKDTHDPQQRAAIHTKMAKSDEKIQSLAVLMLHYCAGLQHCMEQMEVEKNKSEPDTHDNDDTYVSIQSDSLLYSFKQNISQSEAEWNVPGGKKQSMFDTSQDINLTPELVRTRSETEYLDAKEGFGNEESPASVEFMEVNSPEATNEMQPDIEFEQQLSNVLEVLSQSDDEDEIDLPNYQEDHFSYEEPLNESSEFSTNGGESIDVGDKMIDIQHNFHEDEISDVIKNDDDTNNISKLCEPVTDESNKNETSAIEQKENGSRDASDNPMADSLTDEMADRLADEAANNLAESADDVNKERRDVEISPHLAGEISNIITRRIVDDLAESMVEAVTELDQKVTDDSNNDSNGDGGQGENSYNDSDTDDKIADDLANSMMLMGKPEEISKSDEIKSYDIGNIADQTKSDIIDTSIQADNNLIEKDKISAKKTDETATDLIGDTLENEIDAESEIERLGHVDEKKSASAEICNTETVNLKL